jgi:hypothetical protein
MSNVVPLTEQKTPAIPADSTDAAEIGALYRNSAKTMLESINARLECGRRHRAASP